MKIKYHIIIVTVVLFFYGCKQEYTQNSQQLVSNKKNVRAVALQGSDRIVPITATGTLFSKKEIVLSFIIGGIVNRLKVDKGETVQLNQQIGSLNLSEINAQVTGATNSYEKSVRDLERATNLYRDTVGTLEQLQNAKTANAIANSNLEIARFNRRFAVINSPVEGKVLDRYVEVGQLVSPGQPVYKIGSSGTKGSQVIRVSVSDKDVVKISLQDSATVRFDAFANAEYWALVTQITQSASSKTGLFEIELTFKEYKPELRNGFLASICIAPSQKAPTYKIPMNALVEGDQKKASIFYTEDNVSVKYKEIEVLDIMGDYFTISTDVIPHRAKVITEGALYLIANDSINIVK